MPRESWLVPLVVFLGGLSPLAARADQCPDPAAIEQQAGSLKEIAEGIATAGAGCAKSLLSALDRVHIGPTDYARVRSLLQRAGVPLPPYSGWFDPPKLKPGQLPPHRRVDPLAAVLGKLHRTDPLARRVASVLAVIEALGRQDSLDVAPGLVKFTFRLRGFAFRAMVGRALERLGPRAVPGLLALASRKAVDYKVDRFAYLTRKYARYMLGVLEEGDPAVALSKADRKLKAALLKAYGEYRVADAVPAVIARTDDPDPLVRQAARFALEAYFKGPRPRSMRRRLKLPGGRETERRQLVYMNYRQRAVYELRKELERLTGGDYERTRTGKALVAMLYLAQEHHRKEVRAEAYERLKADLSDLRPDKALEALDRFLSKEPRPESWPGFADLLQGLAFRTAGQGMVEQAGRLVLMVGLIRGGRGLDVALADADYLHGLQAEAGGDSAGALAWYLRALERDGSHPGASRAKVSLIGQPPSWVQLAAFLLLLVVVTGFVWFVVANLRSRVSRHGPCREGGAEKA